MKDTKTLKPVGKLSRAQLREALDTVPVNSLFSPAVSKELTTKQKRFCLEVAKGETKANAYRKAYNVKSKNTLQREPYQLTRDQRITNEIEAMQAAIRAQEYQTPAALRALVIQSLVGVITDPDSKPGQITAAAKVLGTVTEVAAFTERKEVRTITSSETARAQVLEQLRTLVQGSATDATIIDREADSLLAELAGGENVEGDTHPGATPQTVSEESLVPMHTIPHERSPHPLSSAATPTDDPSSDDAIFMEPDPTPSTQDDPPSLV
jgi:hypothetical protein